MKRLGLGLTFWYSWKASSKWHFHNCVASTVKKRGRDSLNSPFPVSVQFPGASRHQRGPGMQLLTSEAYLLAQMVAAIKLMSGCSTTSLTLVLLFYCLNVPLFNLFTFLDSQTAELSSLQPEYQKPRSSFFSSEIAHLNKFSF